MTCETKIDTRLVRPAEMAEPDRAGWEALRQLHPLGQSPLLSPAFAEAIAEVRRDVRVVIARQAGRVVACMAVHVRPFGFARPVGAPFDDLAGPLIAPECGLTVSELIKMAGLSAYQAKGAIVIGDEAPAEATAPYVIDARGTDGEAYLETRRKAHPKRFKNFRRLQNKLTREKGEVAFGWGRPDAPDLRQLLAWKSEQFTRDGLLDVTRATHSRAILDKIASLAPEDAAAFGGFMVTLRCKGELIAGHFGVREGAHFHPWISAYRPDFADYAPGMVLLKRVVGSMAEMGLETYQLADGHGHYKKYFATEAAPIAPVSVTAPGLAGAVHAASHTGWRLIGAARANSAGARLMRRLDHIAVCEPGMVTRAKQFAYAVAKRSRTPGGSGAAEA
ncbi:MAG: GNAT family N-acetyltransferase [Pseudomonadota bacterium]